MGPAAGGTVACAEPRKRRQSLLSVARKVEFFPEEILAQVANSAEAEVRGVQERGGLD